MFHSIAPTQALRVASGERFVTFNILDPGLRRDYGDAKKDIRHPGEGRDPES
jgi:hypothetical protein